MIVKNTNSHHSDKDIADNDYFLAAKVNTSSKLCGCPGSEPGKIKIDVSAHEHNCWVKKRLLTKRFTIDTSVTPHDFHDGYSLGAAV